MKNILLGLGKIIVFLIISIILIKTVTSNNFSLSLSELSWRLYIFIAFLCSLLVIIVKPDITINFLDLFKIKNKLADQDGKIDNLRKIIETKSEAKSEAKIEHHNHYTFNVSDTVSSSSTTRKLIEDIISKGA